jgi:hypothetical protein
MPVTYENIATTTLGGATATIDFSSIPQTYTDLRLVLQITPAISMYLVGRFNSSSALGYSENYFYGNGSSLLNNRHNNYTFWQVEPVILDVGVTYFFTMDIFSYTSTTTNKSFLQTFSGEKNASQSIAYRSVGRWENTGAINALSISSNFSSAALGAGTIATLYGIKAA